MVSPVRNLGSVPLVGWEPTALTTATANATPLLPWCGSSSPTESTYSLHTADQRLATGPGAFKTEG